MPTDLLLRGSIGAGSMLALGGMAIVVTEVARRRRIWTSVLTQRWLTWLVLAALWLGAAAFPAVRVAVLVVLAVVGTTEYARLRPSLVTIDRIMMTVWSGVWLLLASLAPIGAMPLVAGMTITSVVFPLVSQDVRNGGRRIGDQLMGYLLVVIPLVMFHRLAVEWGGAVFFAIGMAVAISDVVAFVVGTSWGRRRLAPRLSPNKTVAGLVGGFVGAALGFGVAVLAGLVDWRAVWLVSAVTLGGAAGDLLVSLFKRHQGVKDAGSWLPGFGGLLDRIDSLLLVGPVTFVAIGLIGGI